MSFSDWDYTGIKEKNSYYGNSLLYRVEFGIDADGYKYGVWKFFDKDDNTIYGRFIEDETTFTLIDNETEEVLGVYNKLIGYDYLDDSGYDAGSTSAGGSTSADGSTSDSSSSDNTSSNNDDSTTSDPNMKPNVYTSSSDSTVSSIKPNIGGYTSVYDTDNPAVTPEVVSAVDELKDADKEDLQSETGYETVKPNQKSNGLSTSAAIIVGVVIGGIIVGVILYKTQKKK